MSVFWLNDPSVLFKEIPDNITFIDNIYCEKIDVYIQDKPYR